MPPQTSRLPVCIALAVAAAGCAPTSADLDAGDVTLHARADGSFDLVVGGRTLLSGAAGPVEIQQFDPTADLLWGQFDYQTGPITGARPARFSSASLDGSDLVLALAGDGGAAATLRFTRAADEVTVKIHGEAPGIAQRALALRFACTDDARFLGFGEQYEKIDHRGEAFPLWTSEQGIGRDPMHPSPFAGNPWTTYFPVPFFLDPRGFGLAVDTDAHVAVDLCAADAHTYALTVDDPGDVTLHLYTGPTVADVVRAFTVRQGRAAPPPRWAVDGVWIGVQGGPQRVLDTATRAAQAGVPVGAVWVQDWIGDLPLGGGLNDIKYHWTVDPTLYPDLAGMIATLHASNVRFLGYFNPFIVPKYDQWAEAAAKGYTIHDPSGAPYQVLISVYSGSMLDLTNPEAVAWFQTFVKTALAMGMDGWMGDFGEWLPYDAVLHQGDAPHEHQRYPTRWHHAMRDVLDADKVVFTRSGWLGEGGAAQVVWAGDQQADWSTWDGLPTVVPALISLGLSGIGWVTHDIAGYSGGPSTKELWLRWCELGAFTPIMRTHEGLDTVDNWRWDSEAETTAALARFGKVHKALADTFVALEGEHAKSGMPIVRALALGWPDDPRAVGTADEFTIGRDLLVAPVVTQGATTRAVYFPKGHWVDVWDPSISYDGPVEKTVDAPIGRPPAFSQSGRTDLKDIH